MSDSDPCPCGECVRAGVDRPSVTVGGQALHGRELLGWYQAREEFKAAIEQLKDPSWRAAARKLGGV